MRFICAMVVLFPMAAIAREDVCEKFAKMMETQREWDIVQASTATSPSNIDRKKIHSILQPYETEYPKDQYDLSLFKKVFETWIPETENVDIDNDGNEDLLVSFTGGSAMCQNSAYFKGPDYAHAFTDIPQSEEADCGWTDHFIRIDNHVYKARLQGGYLTPQQMYVRYDIELGEYQKGKGFIPICAFQRAALNSRSMLQSCAYGECHQVNFITVGSP